MRDVTDIPLYQIDAFAEHPFEGNPAAVCPLEDWPDDDVMQAIAAENNLSETAFLAGGDGVYDLRWFTPKAEVDLCGHATLASAHVVCNVLEPGLDAIRFETRSGALWVRRTETGFSMNFPARPAKAAMTPKGLQKALGAAVMEFRQSSEDWMAVLADRDIVAGLAPDFGALAGLDCRGLIVTAKGDGAAADGADFVSRFFAPRVGVNEDPVTGSAHCVLAPYWAKRLKQDAVLGRQISARGGWVQCRMDGTDRIDIAGRTVAVMEGVLHL
jgi:PhzF family phenazine biosynthesis protein